MVMSGLFNSSTVVILASFGLSARPNMQMLVFE